MKAISQRKRSKNLGIIAPVTAILLIGCLATSPVHAETKPTLEQAFRDPPQEARPRVRWHWLNGNVTKDGIGKDLAWMKRMGIGGVQTFDISFRRSISPNPGTSTYAKAMSRPHMPPPLRIPMMLRTAGTLACSAQGRTAERVMIHADSRAINLVDQKMVYVGISRAKVSAAVYTDDRAKLVSGIMQRAGEKQVAIGTGATTTHRLTKHTGASLG